ncbi:hypothetical protein K439DRAFT_1625686, partial [Ramaria rubella]
DVAAAGFGSGVATAAGVGDLWKLELEAELRDAACPVYDQLSLAPAWWVLEVVPMKERYQKSDNTWASVIAFNLARPRIIPHQAAQGFKVHRSVRTRMEMEGEKGVGRYVPRAKFTVEPEWVD